MKPVSEDELAGVDFPISIVPPADALSLAGRLTPALYRAARKTVFIDFNAIDPQTTKKVAQIVQETGALVESAPPPRQTVPRPEKAEIKSHSCDRRPSHRGRMAVPRGRGDCL